MIAKEVTNYLTDAFGFFNKHIFDNALPPCIVTLSRRKGAYGYFFPKTFEKDGAVYDEVALTPTSLERSTIESLATLVHEMVHLWQEHYGKPSGNYHNKQWSRKMVAVGLQPFNVQNPKLSTGPKCSHSIIVNGLFEQMALKFMTYRGEIELKSIVSSFVTQKPTVKKRPVLYCPTCDNKLTVPFDAQIIVTCTRCNELMKA